MIFVYIDPGAGSMVVQAILAGLLAIPFLLRTQVSRIVSRLRGHTPDKPDDQPPD